MVFLEALLLVITTIMDTIILFSIPIVLLLIVSYLVVNKL